MRRNVLEWKNPLLRDEEKGNFRAHPAGFVDLSDESMDAVEGGTTWPCLAIGTAVAVTIAYCGPNGTLIGSCKMGTRGCC